MAKVLYEMTFIRTVEVTVSDEELATLKACAETDTEIERLYAVRDAVITRAVETVPEAANYVGMEWCNSVCMDEDDNELFDVVG